MLLRTVHIIAVVGLGAHLLGAVSPPLWPPAGLAGAILSSGLAMFAIDLYHDRAHVRQVAGLAVLVKLALTAGLIVAPNLGLTLFWVLIVLSAIVSHAPKRFRHHVVFRPAR